MLSMKYSRSVIGRRIVFAGILVFAAVFATNGGAHAQCGNEQDLSAIDRNDPRYPALQQALDTFFAQQQAAQGFSGISLHVSLSARQPALNVTSGKTSFRDGRPFCVNTLFGIGSITKSFTSVLILKLEAAGKLDIHDTLGKWLPQYPEWSSIPIRQLLNMTAPTDDYLNTTAFQAALVANIHRTFSPKELVAYAYPGDGGAQPPWHYSNTNYILAGMIISKATGLSYAEALKRYLFEPLDLETAYYEPRVAPAAVLAAMPANYDEGSQCLGNLNIKPPCAQQPLDTLLGHDVKTLTLSVYGAAGGIIASLPDTTRWVRAMFSDTLLPPRQKAELFSLVSETSGLPIETTSAADPKGFSLGIAQAFLPFTQSPIWYYEGEPFGDRVAWLRRPDDKLIVVTGLNSSATTTQDMIGPLYEAVLKIVEPKAIVTGTVGSGTNPGGD